MLAIDPGPVQSGWVLCEGMTVKHCGVYSNGAMLSLIEDFTCDNAALAIEMIASYGMPVGAEVFETCVWIGRFKQAWHTPEAVRLVYRKDVKLHLCNSPRAKDANVRQALLDLYPATGGGKTPQIGTKAKPGPLYGMHTHAWPALGVAITAARSPA